METRLTNRYTDEFTNWLRKELYYCYLQTRKGKRKTYDEHNFEMFALENINGLLESIVTETYQPGKGIAFITTEPVIREIFAAKFRDRIVHHFIYDSVAEWWDRRFIYDSYSCRPGKGTLFGILRLSKMMDRVSRGGVLKNETYSVTMDISGFFMNLKRKLLYERIMWGLDRQMNKGSELYRVNKYLWAKTIFDDPTSKVQKRGNLELWRKVPREKTLFGQPFGQGIVIGNLSSQLSSNIYMDLFDRFVRFNLGYKYYGRYVDDFFLLLTRDELVRFFQQDLELIKDYLMGMGLRLHAKKIHVQPLAHGTRFLGANVYCDSIQLGPRVVKNMQKTIREFGRDRATIEQMVSVLGHAKNYDGIKVLMKLFQEMGWDYLI